MPATSTLKTITRAPDWRGPAVRPGEMLLEEFLKPLGLRQAEAAARLGISANRLNEVVLGKRRITGGHGPAALSTVEHIASVLDAAASGLGPASRRPPGRILTPRDGSRRAT